MGGKRRAANPDVLYQTQDGRQVRVAASEYNRATALGNQINSSDISSLDREEMLGRINEGLSGNERKTEFTKMGGMGGMIGRTTESVTGALNSVQSEMADAVAGTKPKYRYRKYLDQVRALQQDQPGQMQTILSRGTRGVGSVLGGTA